MTKIVVVEDTESDQKLIKKIISPFYFKFEEEITASFYNKYCKELEKEIADKSQRKIYILDIDLQSKLTGINIALKIREDDWDSEIIFLTNHDSYHDKVYDSIFKVFTFIEKFDHMEERLSAAISIIFNKNDDTKMFHFKNNQIELRIYLKDILYIYRDKEERKLVIKTTNNSFMVNKTINEMLNSLDSRFRQVHRSCIVNEQRVRAYKWTKGLFVLDNGEEVQMLSKNFKEENYD